MENSTEISQKKKKKVIQQYDPAILLWGMYSKEFKVVSLYILKCSQHYSQ